MHTTYIRYIGHIVHIDYIVYPTGFTCIPYILYKIYCLYYTMDYVINLLITYKYILVYSAYGSPFIHLSGFIWITSYYIL